MSENYISQRRRGAIRINVGPRHVVLRLSLAALADLETEARGGGLAEIVKRLREESDGQLAKKILNAARDDDSNQVRDALNALSPKSAADAAAKIAVAAFAPEPDDDSILPWKELFPYAVLSLGLDPRAFWELTPAELSTLLAWRKNRDADQADPQAEPMTREQLNDLIKRDADHEETRHAHPTR